MTVTTAGGERWTALRLGAIAAVALASYLFLASNDYLAVDGALRGADVLRRAGWFIDGNNHLLYPVWLRTWARLLVAFGYRLDDVYACLRAAQSLDALAAAASVGAFAWIARRITGSWLAAGVATAVFGTSHALMLHATHGSEALVGLAWSLLGAAMLVRGVESDSLAGIAVAGALEAIAMASYQSMVLPSAGLAFWAWAGGGRARRGARLLVFAGTSALAALILYGGMYALTGTIGLGAMLERFVHIDGYARVYGGLGVGKLANLPLGLANAVAPVMPPGYAGLRSLQGGSVTGGWAAVAVAAMAAAVGYGTVLALGVWTAARRAGKGERAAWTSGAIALAAVTMPLVSWNPVYDKLWLQPVAILILGTAVLVRRRLVCSARALRWIAAVGVSAVVAADVAHAVRARVDPQPFLAEADQVAAHLGPDDLLVRGWDPISFTEAIFTAEPRRSIDLVELAVERGAGASAVLEEARRAAWSRGGRVYYLGLLDADRGSWAFLEGHAGLPAVSLAEARARAKPVARFECRGARVTLWEEAPPRPVGVAPRLR